MNVSHSIPGRYFDGVSSRLYRVQFNVEEQVAVLTGDAERRYPLSDLRISERTKHAARRVTFPDGDYLEIDDRAAFDHMLLHMGHSDSFVVRAQQSWRTALGFTLLTCVILVLGYLYGLPFAAKYIARSLPPRAEMAIGEGALNFLDQHVFAPSTLPADQQKIIRERFAKLIPASPVATQAGMSSENSTPIEIVFRHSKIGPNAFALPSRQIVLTDEIVNLLNNNDELMGVLAHELGHLNEHHLMRRLIQSSAVGIGATALFGDVSGLVAGIPPLLLDLKYSRDVESDADDYAVATLKFNHIAVENFARAIEKLAQSTKNYEPNPYLSTHPVNSERIARIRKAE